MISVALAGARVSTPTIVGAASEFPKRPVMARREMNEVLILNIGRVDDTR